MSINKNNSFTFIVLTYNHENYILEHLESIRYLVLKYRSNSKTDLIVTDDCSKDLTQARINKWLKQNSYIFNDVTYLRNDKNLGTCKSLRNALNYLRSDICKITAGDDVYSHENIFENALEQHNINIISGRTLYLNGTNIEQKWSSKIFETATNCIYNDKPLISRLIGYNYTNAPNLFYPIKVLKDARIMNFMTKFNVIEDFPLQLATAKYYPETNFQLNDKVYVYYRRTSGSTYLIKNEAFLSDLEQAYASLYKESSYFHQKMIVWNRMTFLKLRSRYLKRILNLESYLFLLQCLLRAAIICWNRNLK